MQRNEDDLPPVVGPPQPDVSEAPEASDAPRPVESNDPVLNLITAVGLGTVALGGLLVPAFLSIGHTSGATRSAKIEWERRQLEMEQVIEQDQSHPAAPTMDADREDRARDGDPR